MNQSVAIVGIACRYPDAASPDELWQNVLSQRRAFRRIPPERLNLDDYYSEDKEAPDRIYQSEAALIEGYEFDRVRFRVAGSTFRATDLTHWLALDIASQALADAGFANGKGLPHTTTGVIVGNTLTGEFSRAHVMRLRWPYVRRVVEASLLEEGWAPEQRQAFLANLEAQYKSPFPAIGEDTLAGGLANTIAGRICNYFDLKGGGYIVDGACASSLLAVKTACAALSNQEMDVAIAGGVDLSIDPFELVGFAKTGALTPADMRIYDKRSAGFLPGEGCGMVVLMRYEDAVAQNRLIYALIRGWGVSSDGSGGMTRPEIEGQTLALQRAYARSGFGVHQVSYIEGHGTGTAVGDAIELQTLSRARQAADPNAAPALIGSIKANIGHTKAAAGIAGLIKATMALHTQILPPTTGSIEPHPELTGRTGHAQHAPALRVSQKAEAWPAKLPLRAGVSAMGFGGINAHIVLEGIRSQNGLSACSRRRTLTEQDSGLHACTQDAELILLAAKDASDLRQQVEHLLTFAAQLSRAEVGDLAAQLASTLPMSDNREPSVARAAIIASNAKELERRLERLRSWLLNGTTAQQSTHVFLGIGDRSPQIAFVFPGQGAPANLDGGALRGRFEFVEDLYLRANLPTEGRGVLTSVAQPAIVSHSMAALRVLAELGIEAQVAVGHSLGELTALHWGGAFDEQSLLCIATVRGQIMANLGGPPGAMASLGAGAYQTRALLNGSSVTIACLNSPTHTVISGEARAVDGVVAKARLQGTKAKKLAVSHAFHSPLVAPAVPSFGDPLSRIEFAPLRQSKRRVFSTVTGALLDPNEDLRELLYRQITDPVRFTEAMSAAAEGIDLIIEVGPGQTLHGLVAQTVDTPIVSLNAGGDSLKGLLQAVGAAFALGAPVNHQALFKGRFTKPFDLNWQPKFFANPCELAPKAPASPPPSPPQY
ncbi:MAG: type I polyketide synthase [Ardenticatenaceae bacterium]